MASPEIAVVIPTLNEERTLEACLDLVGNGLGTEVVVSDGGSTDSTVKLAERLGARVVVGEAGRGPQLNRGPNASHAQRLLFVHADCRRPVGWRHEVLGALDDDTTALACFRLRTEAPEGASMSILGKTWLKTLDLRSRGLRLPYGDQGFGIRRSTFDEVGGFPEIPLMEDLAFARNCRKFGRIRRLRLFMRTTARRTEGQPFRARAMWVAFPVLFRLGVSPHRLAKWYGNVR